MDKSEKKIIYFTNTFPSYRRELWEELLSSKKIEFHAYFSKKKYLDIGLASIKNRFSETNKKKLHSLSNFNISGHTIFQPKAIKVLLFESFDIAILIGDMKILSNWIGILICRIRKKKVVFWTHGIYGNEKGLKKKIRLFFLSQADQLLLYENRAKRILLKHNFSEEKLHVVYNSINLKTQTTVYKKLTKKRAKNKKAKPHKLIFFGRLTKIKKVDLLIPVLASLNQKTINYQLKIVGNGAEKQYLETLVKKYKAEQYIEFAASTYDEAEIGDLFFEADLLVSPGNVGLNAVHALSYGTPVLTHSNFKNQMPEHEAIIDNFNGCFHVENDIESIAQKIHEWFTQQHNRNTREVIRQKLIEKYNPLVQLQIFEKALA